MGRNRPGVPVDFTSTDLGGKETGMLHYILFNILLCVSIFYLSAPSPLFIMIPLLPHCVLFIRLLRELGANGGGPNAWQLPISGSA